MPTIEERLTPEIDPHNQESTLGIFTNFDSPRFNETKQPTDSVDDNGNNIEEDITPPTSSRRKPNQLNSPTFAVPGNSKPPLIKTALQNAQLRKRQQEKDTLHAVPESPTFAPNQLQHYHSTPQPNQKLDQHGQLQAVRRNYTSCSPIVASESDQTTFNFPAANSSEKPTGNDTNFTLPTVVQRPPQDLTKHNNDEKEKLQQQKIAHLEKTVSSLQTVIDQQQKTINQQNQKLDQILDLLQSKSNEKTAQSDQHRQDLIIMSEKIDRLAMKTDHYAAYNQEKHERNEQHIDFWKQQVEKWVTELYDNITHGHVGRRIPPMFGNIFDDGLPAVIHSRTCGRSGCQESSSSRGGEQEATVISSARSGKENIEPSGDGDEGWFPDVNLFKKNYD